MYVSDQKRRKGSSSIKDVFHNKKLTMMQAIIDKGGSTYIIQHNVKNNI